MREHNPFSLRGNVLHVGLFGQSGMLHRAKYSRFRNDSITSLDDGMQSPTPVLKVPSSSCSSSSCPPSTPGSPADQTSLASSEEGSTTFCTFLPRMANIKLSNPAGLLGLKSFALATKEVQRTKLTNSVMAHCAPASPEISLTSYLSASSPLPQDFHIDKLGTTSTKSPGQGGGQQPGTEGSLSLNKLGGGTEQTSQDCLETGMIYYVKYIGCLEVLQSMRMLDFGTRTQVTREAISRLCETVPCVKGAAKRKKPPSKGLSAVLGKSNLQFAGMNIKLIVSTNSLILTTVDSQQQIIAHHHMQSISFASGGDPDATDYVAYVAKDPVNQRACHILECPDGLAQEVISAIGQAFELRFRQFLNNPSSLITPQDSRMAETDSVAWTVENKETHEYYNEIPGKQPPPGGILDMRIQMESAVQKTQGNSQCADQLRRSGSPQHINVYENCSLTQKQLCPTVEATKAVYNCLPDISSLSVLQHIKEQLRNEVWYHGKMCRKEAESLLTNNGDFLVRESTTSPGQYVLSGLQEGTAKHLLLVDPEGMVRTKDHLFNSVGHLIRYHVKNQRPIISSGSELCLREPVRPKQHSTTGCLK
ncbi:SHC-transforming protein 3-like isoform X1 [Acipenser ruthenus]|uniref:SHC-transforming protein 3-like isoform X1 n=1 Tax=Acipenser ruthenus TaxID=7906 RepID=UPI002740332B|nr:SHC-transforming protein 3-like isoform X1 [Acipenser ruthenus]